MSQSPFGDPPPGTDLSDNHRGRNDAAVITTYALAGIAVSLRFFTRSRLQQVSLAADDWLILAALFSVTGSLISTIIGGHYGLGKHVWSVPLSDVITVMQILFAYVLLYVVNVPLIKFSVLLFYRRIFGMNWMMWVCVFLTVGYFVACPIAFLVACRPVSYYWSQYEDPTGGKCVFDLYPFYIGNAIANVVTDAIILVVPIPIVWSLQMRTTQKVFIIGIFLLGGFICVASIIRIHYMTFLKSSADITWIMGDVFIWSSVEPSVGIVCACLPTLQPLLRLFLSRVLGTSMRRYEVTPGSGPPSRKPARRQKPHDWDEELLVTHDVHVNTESSRHHDGKGERITVEREFQLEEVSQNR